MIDYEDWKPDAQKPENLTSVVTEILLGTGGRVSLEQSKGILAGLRIAKDALSAVYGDLEDVFSKFGEVLDSTYKSANVVEIASKLTGIPEESLGP